MPHEHLFAYRIAGRTTPAGGSYQNYKTIVSLSSKKKRKPAPRQPSNTGAPSPHKKIPSRVDTLEDVPVTSRHPIGTIQCPDTFVKVNVYDDYSVDPCPQGPCPCSESEEVKPSPVREAA